MAIEHVQVCRCHRAHERGVSSPAQSTESPKNTNYVRLWKDSSQLGPSSKMVLKCVKALWKSYTVLVATDEIFGPTM